MERLEEASAAAPDVRRAHRVEMARTARETGILGGALLLVAFPLWSLFDRVHEPGNADSFFLVRVLVEAAALVLWALLCTRRFGRRHAEALVLTLLILPGLALAWMLGRLDGSPEPYLLGVTLPLFGSAFLLIWRWQLTAVVIGVTSVAVALALFTASTPPSAGDTVTAAFYLTTAAVICLLGQLYRHRLAWREFRARTELQRSQERSRELLAELQRLSREDGLTGLANRRCWDEQMQREVDRARRTRRPLSVLLCDVDHFKLINDRHGHAQGDAVLRQVGARIASRVRASDVVARLGGDEVAVCCPETTLEDAAALALDLRQVLRGAGLPHVTVSIGVAALEAGDVSPEPLLDRADQELYRAKLTRDAVWAGGRRRDEGSAAPPLTAPTP
jgi:diguanylate cyclase (GGDEF)-like protein